MARAGPVYCSQAYGILRSLPDTSSCSFESLWYLKFLSETEGLLFRLGCLSDVDSNLNSLRAVCQDVKPEPQFVDSVRGVKGMGSETPYPAAPSRQIIPSLLWASGREICILYIYTYYMCVYIYIYICMYVSGASLSRWDLEPRGAWEGQVPVWGLTSFMPTTYIRPMTAPYYGFGYKRQSHDIWCWAGGVNYQVRVREIIIMVTACGGTRYCL